MFAIFVVGNFEWLVAVAQWLYMALPHESKSWSSRVRKKFDAKIENWLSTPEHTMGNGKSGGLIDNLVFVMLIRVEQHLCYFTGSF